MANDRLPKRAAELREQGRRRSGRPRLRWEDCVKRDVRKAGEEKDWKTSFSQLSYVFCGYTALLYLTQLDQLI